jgi:hypothetical protein
MDMDFFRRYEYDLFHKDSPFVKYTHAAPLIPPRPFRPHASTESTDRLDLTEATNETILLPGKLTERPGHDLAHSGPEGTDNDCERVATIYETDLANRAYNNLFANRSFTFAGLRPEILERELGAWREETDCEQARDQVVIERLDGLDDPMQEEHWYDHLATPVEDRSWDTLFDGRRYNLDELTPEVRNQEIANWRAEIIRLNKEDRHTDREAQFELAREEYLDNLSRSDNLDELSIDQLYNRLDGQLELHRDIDLNRTDPIIIDRLEKIFKHDIDIDELLEKSDRLPDIDKDLDIDSGQDIGKDINQIIFGDEPTVLLNEERKSDIEIKIESWERDAFQPDLIKEHNDRSELPGLEISHSHNSEYDPSRLPQDQYQSLEQVMQQQVQRNMQIQIEQTITKDQLRFHSHEHIWQSKENQDQEREHQREDDRDADTDERSR